MNAQPATSEATTQRVCQTFADCFDGPPGFVAKAPGRVNLIGEHTDYNDGFVLPAAISVHVQVALRQRDDSQIRVVASDLDNAESCFSASQAFAEDPDQPWANYVRGIVAAMRDEGCNVPGAELAIAGTVPRGAGLSSSAALGVALGSALNHAGGLRLTPTAIARIAQSAEGRYVGTQCGIMDQLVSALGSSDHALLIDCRSLECRAIRIPEDMAIIIVHSGISRGLVEGHYNLRRRQCEAVAQALGVPALRDATMEMLDAARDRIDPEAARRARHVITENQRVLEAADALASGNRQILGELMAESHRSMRDDFAITTPDIDRLVAELQQLIGNDGGARMTGGGFGGAVVALAPAKKAEQIAEALTYRTPAGDRPLIMVERASNGAQILSI